MNELNIYKLSHTINTTNTINNAIIEKCDQSIQVDNPEGKEGVAVVEKCMMESVGVVNSVSSINSM